MSRLNQQPRWHRRINHRVTGCFTTRPRSRTKLKAYLTYDIWQELLQDPTNPLSREEQKKAWQSQSHKNVLVKKTLKALEIEKKEMTKEEKVARWKVK